MRRKVQAAEPIAIVGMACKFPGASDTAALWRLLEQGGNAITQGIPGSGVGRIGRFYPRSAAQYDACRFAALMDDIDLFDAEFFRISPVEAQLLDPQQRIALETCWQAVEDAGINPEGLKGTRTGVLIGISNNDYRHLSLASAPQTTEPAASLYTVSGTSFNTVAGRIAFAMDLAGPAMALDTACSSSLVAAHNAVSLLQQDEVDLMLVGGVQAIFTGLLTQLRAQAGMLSPDGQCKAFDASANGFVRGEGCGVVALKRLSDAEADGDPIWGTVLGSAINQDGATSGLTVPSAEAQIRVIEEALTQAGIAPSEVDYLEAHGTGTQVGDPIELNSAARAYGKHRDPDRPLLVGSIKTNLGHLEPTAGVAGLIKVLLSMQHGVIPKHLHFDNPNPAVDWENLPVRVTSDMTDWPVHPERPPRAGISSYGWSGTNAHIVVEGYVRRSGWDATRREILRPAGSSRPVTISLPEWASGSPTQHQAVAEPKAREVRLLPLSGKSDAALRDLAGSYLTWLDEMSAGCSPNLCAEEGNADITWSASVGRPHFDHRASVVFRDADSLRAGLSNVGEGENRVRLRPSARIAFVYTGQGSQWEGMGEALYESEPIARAILDRCDELVRQDRGASLLDVMFGSPGAGGDLHHPAWTQPAIFALEASLTALWASLGVRPDVVLGHSLGEIAAAHAAGAFSLEEGLRFASLRGSLMGSVSRTGAMAAVFAPRSDVLATVEKWNTIHHGEDLCIGVDNGTHQVVSGPTEAVHVLADCMEVEGVRVRRLPPSPAYHSALVEPVLDDLEAFFETSSVSPPTTTFISSMTGRVVDPNFLLDGPYWRKQSRRPVAFSQAVETLAGLGVEAVVELGPHAILGPLVSLNWPDAQDSTPPPLVLESVLRPKTDASQPERAEAFVRAVAGAFEAGISLSFEGLFVGEKRRRVSVPGYPFQRQRHWVPSPRRVRDSDAHPLLGTRHESARGATMFETEMFLSDPGWLNDHRVLDRVIMPAAVYGSMAATIPLLEGASGSIVEDLQIHSPLVFEEPDSEGDFSEVGYQVQLLLDEAKGGQPRLFEIFSKEREEEGWILHAVGQLSEGGGSPGSDGQVDLEALRAGLEPQDLSSYYRRKTKAGIDFGPSFRSLHGLWTATGEAIGEVVLQVNSENAASVVHPLLLDGCFQVLSATREMSGPSGGVTYLPFGWNRLWLDGPLPERFYCHARMRDREGDAIEHLEGDQVAEVLTGDMWFYDAGGRAIGGLSGFTLKRATRASLLSASEGVERLLYQVEWVEQPFIDRLRSADALTGPGVIAEGMGTFAGYLSSEGVEIDDRAALMADLERLSRSYALAALEKLGWRRRSGETLELAELQENLQVLPEHSLLLGRMLRLLADAGVLVRIPGGSYQVTVGAQDPLPDEALGDAEAFADRMEKSYPHGANELSMLRRSGGALDQVLRGLVDPLSLLFAGEGPGATEFYFTAPASRASNRLLADAVGVLVSGWPEGRRLRIIEVGAGTGSGTAVVLPELPAENYDYMYTDISAGFFAEAENRFADSGALMEYRPLNIERDPVAQGFEAHGYDLVIAVNVLHATRDLEETLGYCRALLAPSGILVAVESLRGRGWQDMTFGQLDGWWRFSDSYRPNHALASPKVWIQALSDAGFTDSAVLGGESHATQGPLGSGVILARGPEEIEWSGGVWILAADHASPGEKLAEELGDLGQTVVVAGRARGSDLPAPPAGVTRVTVEPESREAWESVLVSLPGDSPLKGVVHCASLEGHGPHATIREIAEDARNFGAGALALVQGLLDSGVAPTEGLWFITRGAQAVERDYLRESVGELAGATLWGFGKAIAREAGYLQPRLIDLDPEGSISTTGLASEFLFPDSETHIAYRDGHRLVARLTRGDAGRARLAFPEDPDWRLVPDQDGGLEGLHLEPSRLRSLGEGEVRVAVDAAGLNFSDVLIGMGVVQMDPQLGDEFCGRITEIGPDVEGIEVGDRVVGLGIGTFRPEIVTRAEMVAQCPPGSTTAAMATIPTAFVTVELAFDHTGLESGDRVLVHTASGGVGLAAVQLVQAAGAEVIATASAAKRGYLRELGITHVFDSRSTDFGRQVLEATEGKGVSVVLNSLTGPGFIEASLSCLEEGGRFVELGRRDIWSPEQMVADRPDVSYYILEVDQLKRHAPATAGASLRRVMERMSTGEIEPLVYTRWPMAEIGAAMEFMRSARHVGKNVMVMPPLAHGGLRSDRTYLVTGGLGGIGCVVAGWLADQGAGVIVLNGRRPPDPFAEEYAAALRQGGANVKIELADITDPGAVDAMLARMDAELPPLGGVIHSVGVLSDGSLGNQNWERFEMVLWPKVLGAWRLHQATVNRDLDLFVLFSSVTGVLGNAGQGNHAAANAFLDQVAIYRRSLGLPGQSIAWGAWSGLGEAEEQRDRIERQLAASGTGWITPQQGIRAFDQLVRQDWGASLVASVDWPVFVGNFETPPPILEHLLAETEGSTEEDEGSDLAADLVWRIKAADPLEREGLLGAFLQREVQAVLRLPSAPAPSVGFFDLGMDSLMAVELRNRLNRAFAGEYVTSNTVVFDYPDISSLASHLTEELGQLGEVDDAPTLLEPAIPQLPPALSGDDDAIAAVGMACRLPGASDLAEYWELLESGGDAVTDGRQDGGAWSGAVGDPDAEDLAYRRGAFVEDIDWFDSRFFRISPIEAQLMDPQQRMLLETSWQALEDAGINPSELRGSRSGVYVGIGGSEYRDLIEASKRADSYLGTTGSVAVGRIAFSLGLEGPAMPIDMACASSLAAVHQGVVALQRGEVDLALAGGVNVVLSPSISRFMMDVGMLSPTGHCSPFDASANGYVRGEGCGMVVLKRLRDAEADGDRIWAVIRGSAVNQNGASAGLTVPNGPAQERVMKEALAQAGFSPAQVDYLEAHATGSQLGDPIELNAAASVYGRGREVERPLVVGSVKSNIGHVEWAAGIAAFIKTALMINHGVIPENLHLRDPNPNVEWGDLPLRVAAGTTQWPTVSGRRPVAGVNAFGLSGTNAHVLLEGYGSPQDGLSAGNGSGWPTGSPRQVPMSLPEPVNSLLISEQAPTDRLVRLLPLSAKSPGALSELADLYLSWLGGEQEWDSDVALSDLAWTAAVGRSHFPHRYGLVFTDVEELRGRLRALDGADGMPEWETPRAVTRIAFAYPGLGSQWVGMGEGPYRSEPVARAVLDRCDELILEERGVSLLDVMFGGLEGAQDLNDPRWAQPAVYALQCALTAQWASIGIGPQVALGSGAGSLAAAQAAGVVSLEEGLRLTGEVGSLQGGRPDDESTRERLEALLAGMARSAPSLPLVSSADARFVDPGQAADTEYWIRQFTEPVDLFGCASTLAALGVDAVVEVGPDAGLSRRIGEAWPEPEGRPVVLSTQVKPSGDGESLESDGGFVRAVGAAYEAGLDISFSGMFAGEVRRRVSLPGYPFQRRRHWI